MVSIDSYRFTATHSGRSHISFPLEPCRPSDTTYAHLRNHSATVTVTLFPGFVKYVVTFFSLPSRLYVTKIQIISIDGLTSYPIQHQLRLWDTRSYVLQFFYQACDVKPDLSPTMTVTVSLPSSPSREQNSQMPPGMGWDASQWSRQELLTTFQSTRPVGGGTGTNS